MTTVETHDFGRNQGWRDQRGCAAYAKNVVDIGPEDVAECDIAVTAECGDE